MDYPIDETGFKGDEPPTLRDEYCECVKEVTGPKEDCPLCEGTGCPLSDDYEQSERDPDLIWDEGM
jgi:hypothetical protein